MSKVTRADYALLAGSVKWANVTGKPTDFGGITDIGQLAAAGFTAGQVPVWTGSKFVSADLPEIPDDPVSTGIADLNSPGVATRRQPPGFAFGPTEDVWMQEVFDVRQYGAFGTGANDDTASFNRAIADVNTAGRGVIFAPGGEYNISFLDLITAHCSVIGGGVAATKINVTGSAFQGGASGSYFEVAGMSMVTSGTSGYGVSLSDGSNAGSFSFHDLDLRGFSIPVQVTGTQRTGYVYNSRLDPRLYGVSLTARNCVLANLKMFNDASTAARGMLLAGDSHQVHGCQMLAGSARWNQGILASSGAGCTIANSLFAGVVNEAIELSDGSSGTTGWRVQNITFFDVDGADPVKYNRDKHYVNELHGLGGSTNMSFDARRELAGNFTWDPPALRPFESCYEETYVLGCKVGDQVAIGAPITLDFMQVSGTVRANDIVRITLTNTSPSTINPASGSFKIRAFN